MPQEARERCQSELRKLRSMPPSAAEYTVVRNYVDWLLDLPWNDLKEIDIDIEKARAILEGDHFGLEKPKDRILEYLAVQKLSNGLRGPILCFVGGQAWARPRWPRAWPGHGTRIRAPFPGRRA